MRQFVFKFMYFLLIFIIFFNIQKSFASEKKILMIIAHKDFRDEELLIPKKMFEENGYKVVIASSSLEIAEGMLGAKVKPDILIEDVKINDYKAIVFVGGVGAREYFHNPDALRIVKEAVKEKKVLGAICLAPRILAEAGVLKGKKATVWRSEGKFLETKGAIYTGNPVEVDGKIVTGAGPFAAKEFAKKILKLLEKNN
ncbi:DJ-1 family protein [Candidatus Pacearchaeota archaeon]|nr:MAG: DJ-1 family protein [Candidatus Pacearchaeota archaeon]